jgi:hypothetical protein
MYLYSFFNHTGKGKKKKKKKNNQLNYKKLPFSSTKLDRSRPMFGKLSHNPSAKLHDEY